MKRVNNIIIIVLSMLFVSLKACAFEPWINDLRGLFQANKAVIYAVNLRTFNANDINNDGIIEPEQGEESGNFINAIDRLDEIVSLGVNTLHLLPITPVGKTKALGTAGSLYAASAFGELNPQLKSPQSNLSLKNQAREFINECHARKIRVIVDLPSCAAYDLYLKNPELFKKDEKQNPVVPADWTDVRLLDAGNESSINQDVYNLYRDFVDLMLDLGADGIRADVATIKPYSFWKQLIQETRKRDPQFLFLAEASDSWKTPPSKYSVFTPYNRLLDAGFDGYYGSFFNLKNWKNPKDLYSCVKFNIDIEKKSKATKSVIGSFTTHDEVSPILVNGVQYSKMIVWLNATLPLNPYYVDGFSTGDDYLYFWANKKAPKTETDDDYYFVHRGQLDIFNYSRKPAGKHPDIAPEMILANKFRMLSGDAISIGSFVPLKTSDSNVFAYARSFNKSSVIVVGNLDFRAIKEDVKIYIPNMTPDLVSFPVKLNSIPQQLKGRLQTNLLPGEVQVLYFTKLELK